MAPAPDHLPGEETPWAAFWDDASGARASTWSRFHRSVTSRTLASPTDKSPPWNGVPSPARPFPRDIPLAAFLRPVPRHRDGRLSGARAAKRPDPPRAGGA
ncbi:hypothetical protein GCM10010140_09090 [Streptosporangium pseudovulgare]|uniref:Uncharacterized protein n=1 Tax=Streptosporangium pseudovulgare TaxID=35765 RepID=A0ABQ2QKT8_9ACTN|nr:hypothetical protein GCM10010140_09090 [Streptosporangium pseudovulgare]